MFLTGRTPSTQLSYLNKASPHKDIKSDGFPCSGNLGDAADCAQRTDRQLMSAP